MDRTLSNGYLTFSKGFVHGSWAFAAFCVAALVYMLFSGQSLTLMSNPELADSGVHFWARDLVSMVLLAVALVCGADAVHSDTQRQQVFHPYAAREFPKTFSADLFFGLRPTIQIWVLCYLGLGLIDYLV